MRIVIVVIVQLVIAAVLTALIMPLVLVTTPAAQTDARFGLTLVAAVMVVTFTLIALAWPRRLR